MRLNRYNASPRLHTSIYPSGKLSLHVYFTSSRVVLLLLSVPYAKMDLRWITQTLTASHTQVGRTLHVRQREDLPCRRELRERPQTALGGGSV